MSTADEEAELRKELATVKILRATLESVKQLIDNVHTDVTTARANHAALGTISDRWGEVLKEVDEGREKADGSHVTKK